MILGYINKIDLIDLSVLLFTNNKYEYLKITNIVQAKNEILVVDRVCIAQCTVWSTGSQSM